MGVRTTKKNKRLDVAVPVDATGSADNATATATLPAPGASLRNFVVKVDASFGTSTVSGLLQVKSGTTVIAEKYVHGSGAFDFPDLNGRPAINANEAMSAELAASGTGGVLGKVFIQGHKQSI